MYTQADLAASDFEGWVAWLDGYPITDGSQLLGYGGCTPLLEAVPHQPALANLTPDAQRRPERAHGRHTIDWRDLPHERVRMLELYGFRSAYPGRRQPLLALMAPASVSQRWIQYKRTALVVDAVSATGADANERLGAGVRRVGVTSYVMGYWYFDGVQGLMQTWEVPSNGAPWPSADYPMHELKGRNHPCWPKPLGLGLGLAPHVLGLQEEDVPPLPVGFTGREPELRHA